MASSWPGTTILVCAYNQAGVLGKALDAMLLLDYPNFEIVVVNDGSTDSTKELLDHKYKGKKWFNIIHLGKNSGLAAARNVGIEAAKKEFVVMMDQDCIPERRWLKDLMKGFDSEKVGMVSSFSDQGGTSTVFPKKVLEEIGGFDTKFFFFRDDSDTVFRVLDAGYGRKFVDAKFQHLHHHTKPKGLLGFVRYGIKRVKYHFNDVLLFKKHPKRTAELLDVKFGFLVNPFKDFGVATNLWHPKGTLKLRSPQGLVFIEPKTPLHIAAIILAGVTYVIAVKSARLYASIKYRKLLI